MKEKIRLYDVPLRGIERADITKIPGDKAILVTYRNEEELAELLTVKELAKYVPLLISAGLALLIDPLLAGILFFSFIG